MQSSQLGGCLFWKPGVMQRHIAIRHCIATPLFLKADDGIFSKSTFYYQAAYNQVQVSINVASNVLSETYIRYYCITSNKLGLNFNSKGT